MIRFLFHGGAREGNADGSIRNIGMTHNGALYFAAQNVAKDCKNGDQRSIKITTVADLTVGSGSIEMQVIHLCRGFSIEPDPTGPGILNSIQPQ